jgi:hypothetical protein
MNFEEFKAEYLDVPLAEWQTHLAEEMFDLVKNGTKIHFFPARRYGRRTLEQAFMDYINDQKEEV